MANTELRADDVLLIDLFVSRPTNGDLLGRLRLEELPLGGAHFSDRAQEIGMAEAMVAADSTLAGRTIVQAELRSRSGLTVIGLRRGRTAWVTDLRDERLLVADTLLVTGAR